MRVPTTAVLTALVGGLLSAGACAQEHADLIVTGGRIATLAHGEGFVQALAIKAGLVHAKAQFSAFCAPQRDLNSSSEFIPPDIPRLNTAAPVSQAHRIA